MCVSCREMKGKTELYKIVRTVDGEVTLDNNGTINGRSAYICKNMDCLKKANKRGSVNKSLHSERGNDIVMSLIKEMEAD